MLNIKFELNEKIENYFKVCLYDGDDKLVDLKLSEFEKNYLYNRKDQNFTIFKKVFTYTNKDGISNSYENLCIWCPLEADNEIIVLSQLDYNVKRLLLRMVV